RCIVVEFQSRDPELAARVANSIAEGYLVLQQDARQAHAKSAGQWLSGEIENLRKRVAEAESRVEDFRSKSSLFVGTNNTTLSNQQMGELNTQLNNARALKSDAESKARLIREMLQSGKPIEASEVLNSELTRRLSEQRVTLRAQLAEQSSTLLDGRIISRATVSNTPAYPKKLPIVLIATLASLMLSAGAIATGELLRMTAPRNAAFAFARDPIRAPAPAAVAAAIDQPAPAVD